MSHICILGLTSSGKSTFLSVLSTAFKNSDWNMTAVDTHTDQLLRKYHVSIFEKGTYPEPNKPGSRLPFHLRFQKNLNSSIYSSQVTLIDVAGGEVDPFGGSTVDSIYSDYVKKSRGILFLVDSKINPNFYSYYYTRFDTIISAITKTHLLAEETGKEPWKKLHLAICFTKCDLIREYQFETKSGTESILNGRHHIIGPNASNVLSDFEKRPWVKLAAFACSATGFVVDHKSNFYKRNESDLRIPQWHEDEQGQQRLRQSNIIRPEGVHEPLEWILEGIVQPQRLSPTVSGVSGLASRAFKGLRKYIGLSYES